MKYIKLFESNRYDKLKINFIDLFYRKLCDYGEVVCSKKYDKTLGHEIRFTENNEPYYFLITIKDEIDDLFIIVKNFNFNQSSFYNTLMKYFDNSDFFEKKIDIYPPNVQYGYMGINHAKYKILGTIEEIEEDLEIMVQAKKYNL